jgi:hypothetical protein
VYAQLLILASFLVGAYQDVRERAVSDVFWIPAGVGGALVLVYNYTSFPYLLKAGILSATMIGMWFFISIGTADVIALVFLMLDPSPLSPLVPMLLLGAALGLHVLYLFARRTSPFSKVISLEEFKAEQQWIPKAILSGGAKVEVTDDVNSAREEVLAKAAEGSQVEVEYGVPHVAYIAAGYLGFLAYLALFQPAFFFAFP